MVENPKRRDKNDDEIIEGRYLESGAESDTAERRRPEVQQRPPSRRARPAQPERVRSDRNRNQRNRQQDNRRGGCMTGGCGFFAGLSGLLLVGTFAFIILVGVLTFSSVTGNAWLDFLDIFGLGGEDSEPEVTDVTTILLDIHELARLETLSGDILVEERVEQKNESILRDSVMEIRWVGRVDAGIDLSRISEDDVRVNDAENSITIALPPPEITGCFLQNPQVLESSCGNLVLQSCTQRIEDMTEEAYDKGLEYLYDTALEGDLLGQAYEQAEDVLRNLLDTFGYDSIKFELSTETLPPDPSCVPS